MAFNFENLVNKIKDTASNVVQKTASSTADAILGQEKANELRREHERTAIPEITSYYMNADQEPIDIANKRDSELGKASSSVAIPNDVEAMENDLYNSGYDPDKYLGGEGRSLLNPKFEAEDTESAIESRSIDDLKKSLQEDQDRRLEQSKDYERKRLENIYMNAGANLSNPVFQDSYSKSLEDIDKKTEISPDYAEFERRFLDNSGQMRNPLEWNILGFTSQTKTPDSARDVYDYYFNQEDEQGIRNEDAISTKLTNTIAPYYVPEELAQYLPDPSNRSFGGNEKVVPENIIDDGADPASREALYMTGEQYYKYRSEFGLPGRDLDQINASPDVLYNKQEEQEKYGFIPYITSDESLDKFHDNAVAPMISNLFNDLADLRRNNFDYTLNYDGQRYSGKDFDKNIRLWDARNKDKEVPVVYDESETNEYSIPQTVVAIDEDGNEIVAPNRPVEYEPYGDNGGVRIKFNDNPDDDWIFFTKDDYENNFQLRASKDNEPVLAWVNQEPVVLDSGQAIRADKAIDILENYNNYVDYGFLDLGRPSVENPLEEGGWAPWFIDMVLSSSPYFFRPTSTAKAIGDTLNNWQGLSAGHNINGEYSLLSENPTEEERNTAALASAIMPLTERLWGPLGNAIFKTGPTKKLLRDVVHIPENILVHPATATAMGASDEGVEEIFGNIVEELHQNGLNWYENPVYKKNEDGSTILDEYGRPVEDRDKQSRAIKEDTDPLGRLWNFIKDAPLAYLGGATLGGVLGLGRLPEYKGYWDDYKKANAPRDAEEKEFGFAASRPVDIDALLKTSGLSDDERRYYNS